MAPCSPNLTPVWVVHFRVSVYFKGQSFRKFINQTRFEKNIFKFLKACFTSFTSTWDLICWLAFQQQTYGVLGDFGVFCNKLYKLSKLLGVQFPNFSDGPCLIVCILLGGKFRNLLTQHYLYTISLLILPSVYNMALYPKMTLQVG